MKHEWLWLKLDYMLFCINISTFDESIYKWVFSTYSALTSCGIFVKRAFENWWQTTWDIAHWQSVGHWSTKVLDKNCEDRIDGIIMDIIKMNIGVFVEVMIYVC